MVRHEHDNPLDDLLRARLRIADGADLPLAALRLCMRGIDLFNRTVTGQPFFAIREAEKVLNELDGRTGADLVQVLLTMKGGTTILSQGLDNIPHEGPVIIGATHPTGSFDFVAHAGVLFARRPDLKIVANREAERFLGVDRIIPVDLGRKDRVLFPRQTFSGMRDQLEAGGALLVFGSGRVSDMKSGRLIEPPWRPGITRISDATGAPIVPASGNMRNTRHYYRTRMLARTLSGGNKDFGRTVASLRYASELLEKLGGRYCVCYGTALPPGTSPAALKTLAEGLIPQLYGRETD